MMPEEKGNSGRIDPKPIRRFGRDRKRSRDRRVREVRERERDEDVEDKGTSKWGKCGALIRDKGEIRCTW